VILVDLRTKRIRVESYSRSGLESEEESEADASTVLMGSRRGDAVPPPWEVEYVYVQDGPTTRCGAGGSEGKTVKYVL
jgi:hypothetical protein